MSNLAIRVENLGKLYRIGSKQQSYYTLRDALVDAVMTPMRRVRGLLRGESAADLHEEIWALKDVSFEVKHGEVVGIIGRNGAGKSTLLKVLSRITEPTTGCADVYGRIGALLEVGTGFHPELTGRENIYLNGAILGMSRAEINRKFDEIVDFAGVEKFIDTPVKHYSSGMGLRLGFAVAAHLEPEILIVDEVLAVGDAEFQKKCLGKMSSVAGEGRTVLFVSHNMAAVQSLCKRAILLDRGSVLRDGEVARIVDEYLSDTVKQDKVGTFSELPSFRVIDVKISSCNGSLIKTFDHVLIGVQFEAKENILDPGLYVGFLTPSGERLAGLDLKTFGAIPKISRGTVVTLGFTIENFPFMPGIYLLEIHLKDLAHHKFEFLPDQITFEVVETPVYGTRKLDRWFGTIGLRAGIYDERHQ
jgi:lipopolysaccharide transport system ATP-binding protein